MAQNIQDILSQLDRVNSSLSYEVYIPSLKKSVYFKEMTTAQQKRIIKSIIDSPIYNSEFIKATFNIISENCADTNVNINDFTIIDKLIILLKMRSVSLGNEITVEFQSKLLKDKVSSKINIDDIYDECVKSLKHIKDKKIEIDGISVICGLPNILTEFKLEEQLHNAWEDEKYETKEELQNSVGEKFVTEVCKFIKEINIGDMHVILSDIPFGQRLQIVEKIPTKLLKKVFDYIQQCSNIINKVLLINKSITVGEETEVIEQRLDITSSFFINS